MGVVLGILLTLLLSACTGPNSMGWGTATAIHKAAWNGDADGVRRALSRGQDPNAIAKIPYFDIKGGQKFGSEDKTPLQLAIHNNHPEAAIALLDGGANADSRLVRSAVTDCPRSLQSLLSHGARPDVKDGFCFPMESAAMGGDVESVKLLVDAGVDVNTKYSPEGTALHMAAMRDRRELALWLIEHGAAVDAITSYGSTPLHTAARYCRIEMASLLLDHGADPTRRNNLGDRPINLVARSEIWPAWDAKDIPPETIAARRAELFALLNAAAAKWSPGAETPKP